MRRTTATITGLLLLGSGIALPAAATTAKPTLTISIDLGVGQWERWTLGCSPTRGTHPNRASACALLAKRGTSLFAPVPKGVACTMIYGGPERATVSGTWRGARVKAAFNRTNGCEIARWAKAKALLTVPGTGIVRGAVSLGPTCAVQQQGQDCTNPSVTAMVTATRGTDGRVVKSTAVADRGFAIRLGRGSWALTADAGRSCGEVAITVPDPSAFAGITIPCDTGIR